MSSRNKDALIIRGLHESLKSEWLDICSASTGSTGGFMVAMIEDKRRRMRESTPIEEHAVEDCLSVKLERSSMKTHLEAAAV